LQWSFSGPVLSATGTRIQQGGETATKAQVYRKREKESVCGIHGKRPRMFFRAFCGSLLFLIFVGCAFGCGSAALSIPWTAFLWTGKNTHKKEQNALRAKKAALESGAPGGGLS